jgi:hypothetical protein
MAALWMNNRLTAFLSQFNTRFSVIGKMITPSYRVHLGSYWLPSKRPHKSIHRMQNWVTDGNQMLGSLSKCLKLSYDCIRWFMNCKWCTNAEVRTQTINKRSNLEDRFIILIELCWGEEGSQCANRRLVVSLVLVTMYWALQMSFCVKLNNKLFWTMNWICPIKQH